MLELGQLGEQRQHVVPAVAVILEHKPMIQDVETSLAADNLLVTGNGGQRAPPAVGVDQVAESLLLALDSIFDVTEGNGGAFGV